MAARSREMRDAREKEQGCSPAASRQWQLAAMKCEPEPQLGGLWARPRQWQLAAVKCETRTGRAAQWQLAAMKCEPQRVRDRAASRT